jgi:hypothetical protein
MVTLVSDGRLLEAHLAPPESFLGLLWSVR